MSAGSPKQVGTVNPKARWRRHATYSLAALLTLGAALAWYGGYLRPREAAPPPAVGAEDERFPLPAVGSSPFRNTATTVRYVGSQACMKCHRGDARSYLHTTHSRSLGEIDLAHEPPDGECRHELSGRSYRIYRSGATLRLREFIHDANGKEVVLVDEAARFALGSGNYSRMYLVELDGFLIEAPVTWYPRRQRWGMSAGYEKDPEQRGFSRTIDARCLYCHAGQVEASGGAGERVHVTERALGCERCHGPGELHIQERTAKRPIEGRFDDSIVNLQHLSRATQEDICSQCHLSADADVVVRGRTKAEFRPGLRMADFVVSYRLDRPNSAMTVSGQIQQMRLSRCYVASQSMTCTTCHDPHARPEETAKVAHYRSKCLSCHATEACKLPVQARQAREQDNCIVCHMPRGPTDIPHLSFTHHRVGIHAAQPEERLSEADHLVAVADVGQLPDYERQRQLGLANDIFAGKLAGGLNDETRYDPRHRALARVFQERARGLLEGVRARGVRDPEVEVFFSRLHWRQQPEQCIEHAEAALRAPRIAPATRQAALYNLASSHFDQGRYERALPYLEELANEERSEISLMLLGICHQKKGNLAEAVRRIKQAIRAAPERADLHSYLASLERNLGQPQDADWHMQRAALLRLRVPQPK